jgi:hypothetical protein
MRKLKAEFRQGRTLIGAPRAERCDFSWDLGSRVGVLCSKCGRPKPPFTANEQTCAGRGLVLGPALLRARSKAIPSVLLTLSWERMRDLSVEVSPSFWDAARASFRACFARFGQGLGREQARLSVRDARVVFQAAGTPGARAHAQAVARACAKLCADGHLDPEDQPVLQSLAILQEAEEDGALEPSAVVQALASKMLLEARAMGYYR